MKAAALKTALQNLLDVLSAHQASIEMTNGRFKLTAHSAALLSALEALDVTVADDTLDFSRYLLPRLFSSANYQQRIEPFMITTDFAIIQLDGSGVLFFEQQFYELGSAASLLPSISNAIAYYRLYDFLKSPDFADHHNSADQEIIIYSSTKGILKIGYEPIAPEFETGIADKVDRVLAALTDQQFRTYFKNSLFDLSEGNHTTLNAIIIKNKMILSAAKRDLEIALRQFDFEKFRDALYSQKEKFFIDIRDLLAKIYGQIVGIPISITAAVYATYKTEHEVTVPILILISFIVYVVIYLIIQWSYYQDIKEIQTDFLRDFNIIKTQSGLPQQDINQEYDKVDRKITTTLNIAKSLMVAIVLLGISVAIFIAMQIA